MSKSISKMLIWYILLVSSQEFLKTFKGQIQRNVRILILDLVLAYFSFVLAFFIRSDFNLTAQINSQNFSNSIVYIILIGFLGICLGTYRGKFNRGTLDEVLAINTQAFIASLIVLFFRVILEVGNYPRSIPLITALIFIVLSLLTRIVLRLNLFKNSKSKPDKNILIYGAGNLGLQIANLIKLDRNFKLVGYIDDDPYKSSLVINGNRVVSNLQALNKYLTKNRVEQIIIAHSNLDPLKMIKLSEICGEHKINLRTIESASELLLGVGNLSDLISLNENSLLGRSKVSVDKSAIHHLLEDKIILITGAGGSIGSEIAKQCALNSPQKLYLLDRDETALHSLELELYGTGLLNNDSILLADIRDGEAINNLLSSVKPDIVFHAAALKHLPILQNFPDEAEKTNVNGTRNLINASIDSEVSIFINISTDKAADPSSVLGQTKFKAEQLTLQASRRSEFKSSKFISVRFGNVIGSRGSVLHTFKFQIDHDLPITITHPEVTRYFMTVGEAVSLVLQSAVIGASGETLILDMGLPVRILDVAKFMIVQSGKNIPIEFTGLREGEKLHEVLNSSTERLENRIHPKIFHTKVDLND